MKIRFSPLTTISIAHDYYSEACRDIEFVPTESTRERLRAGRIIARMLEGRLHLLYEAEAPKKPVSDISGETLYFALRLQNTRFANITAPLLADPRLTPLFSNTVSPTTLDAPVGVTVAAGLHAHTPLSSTRPVTLRLLDATGNVLDARMLSDDNTSYDLRSLPNGRYRIEEDYGAGVIEQRQLLIDAELRDTGAWGVLAIRIDDGFYATPPDFTLTFAARSEPLRYYIVTRNWTAEEVAALNIVDEGAATEGRPPIVFAAVPAPLPDDFIQKSLLGDSSADIVVFQSQSAVARRERGLKKLNLNRSTTVLIEHLPLPGPERAKADLIVHLSKP
ncbi:hypothetical protein [Viridibacterium curvum]|uniref:Carboxypeptidase regulatory-like domain-containing protein n=1 Tax=Viridibacterium curvum TaxID=1101404 RepID=A0ABP9QUY7_9RHOO